MKNGYLQIAANKFWHYRRSFFCLAASFCYLLAGQPQKAFAALRGNEEPQKRANNTQKLVNQLNASCKNRSTLDKLLEKPGDKKEKMFSGIEESLFLVGTDSCPGLPIPAGTSFSDTGTTIGANNTVNGIQAGCSNYTTTAGPDVIYQFILPPLASRVPICTITVTPTGATGYDTSIYTLSTAGTACPAGTANNVTNCVNGSDSVFANGAEVITDAEMDAMPAGTYYLFVDSFYGTGSGGAPNRHNGPYSLNFQCTTLAPVAAGVSVSGRILTAGGAGLGKVRVTLTDSSGNTRTALTSAFGYYRFDDVEAGGTYFLNVMDKRFTFANPTRVISVQDAIDDADFMAEP